MPRTVARLRHVSLATLGLLVLHAAPAVAVHPSCRPAASAVDELLQVDLYTTRCPIGLPCMHDDLAAARRLAEAHPDDVVVHRALQTLAQRLHPREAQRDEYARLRDHWAERAAARPDDPVAAYFDARLRDSREERITAYREALEIDPELPWTHLGLAYDLFLLPEASEEQQAAARRHLETFLDACPERFQEPLQVAPRVPGADFWTSRTAALRDALEAAPPLQRSAWLPQLWALEFTLTPPTGHDAVRQRLRRDLARLESTPMTDHPVWWKALLEGYERSGDAAARDAAAARLAVALPCHREAIRRHLEEALSVLGDVPQWNDPDVSFEPAAVVAAHQAVTLLSQRCPQDLSVAMTELELARRHPNLGDAELVAATDRFLEVEEYNQYRIRLHEPAEITAAEVLVERGLQPRRAADLAASAIEERGEDEPPNAESFPPAMRPRMLAGRALAAAAHHLLLAEALIAAGDLNAAGDALATAGERLEPPPVPEDEMEPRLTAMLYELRGERWALRGRLAEAAGATADAVAFHLRAAALGAVDSGAAAERLWTTLGGSSEGLAAATATASSRTGVAVLDPSPWREVDAPLPDFELLDLSGRTWTAQDLAGKTVLINDWATWCGPCREEMPLIQELHERLLEHDDLAVVTFNADRDPGPVAPYLEAEGFSFPVLLAEEHVRQVNDGFVGLPATRIVGPDGVVRFEQTGFTASEAEGWVDAALERMRAAAAAAAEAVTP